ncbi:MAG: hypothetical protein EPO26_06765 [Chloroflexota bacterium]|nr:MAG: hypothetical protein EPO26_06765 [Chloroflexota bacterium]
MADRSLAAELRPFERAARLSSALVWAMRGLAVGITLTLALALASRFGVVTVTLAAWFVLPMAALIIGTIAGLARHRPLGEIASEVDHRANLRERAITALEMTGRFDPLARTQIADAVEHLRRLEPLETFPPRLPKRWSIASLVMALAMIPFLSLSLPGGSGARDRSAEIVAAEAERIEAIAEEIERESVADSGEERPAAAAAVLREIAAQLRQEVNAERALASVGEAERRLSALQDSRAFDAASALARVADTLDRETRTRGVSNALDRRDYARAAREMSQLGPRAAQGSSADRQAIAEALRQAGAAASRYDERLGQALREASERARQGDEGATERATSELNRLGNESRRQEALERALSQLQESRQALTSGREGSGARPSERAAGADGDDPSAGSGAGDRGGQGQGQSGGQGSGGQAGDGEGGDPSSGSGAGTGTSTRTTDVYDPAATRARQVQVPGGDFDRPTFGESEEQSDSADGEVTVDYRSVLPTYQERATRAMQDRYIPLGMKELVREYFSSLQPPGVR